MKEYIVAYSPLSVFIGDTTVYFKNKEEYEINVQKFNKKYGDVIMWNNHFVTVIEAKSASEAFMKFYLNFI